MPGDSPTFYIFFLRADHVCFFLVVRYKALRQSSKFSPGVKGVHSRRLSALRLRVDLSELGLLRSRGLKMSLLLLLRG